MKRADLVRSLAVQFNKMTSQDAAAIIDSVFDRLQQAVADGDRVELRGFGVFQPRVHMTKIGFNPKTGQRIAIPAGKTVKFRPGKELIKEIE